MSKNKKQIEGLFVGKSHADGGIPSVIKETGQAIEIEGKEFFICRESYNSTDIHTFKDKSNLEILDSIYTKYSCTLVQEVMSAGDFIVCKVVVNDKTKHNRNGTVKEILNQMQSEKSCKVEQANSVARKGGKIQDMKKQKRYTADADFYIRATSDKEAEAEARKLLADMDKKYDNRPELKHLTETPFGSLKSRKIFKEGGSISDVEFVEELGGNKFYKYKGEQIMVTKAIDDPRWATPSKTYLNDRRVNSIEQAVKLINDKPTPRKLNFKDGGSIDSLPKSEVNQHPKTENELITSLKGAIDKKLSDNAIWGIQHNYFEEVVSKNPMKLKGLLQVQIDLKMRVKQKYDFWLSISEADNVSESDKLFIKTIKENKINIYDLLPEKYKKVTIPKSLPFSPEPKNENLAKITDNFVSHDDLRPIMGGVFFDKENKRVVATDAHKLLSINADPNVSESKVCLIGKNRVSYEKNNPKYKADSEDCMAVEGNYPRYDAVIPTEAPYSFDIDVKKLLEFAKSSVLFSNKMTRAVRLTFRGSDEQMNIGVNSGFLSDGIKAMAQLGHTELSIILQGVSNKAIILMPKSHERSLWNRDTDICLLMPTMLDRYENTNAVQDAIDTTPVYNLDLNKITTIGSPTEVFKLPKGIDVKKALRKPTGTFSSSMNGFRKISKGAGSVGYTYEGYINSKYFNVTDNDGDFNIEGDWDVETDEGISFDDVYKWIKDESNHKDDKYYQRWKKQREAEDNMPSYSEKKKETKPKTETNEISELIEGLKLIGDKESLELIDGLKLIGENEKPSLRPTKGHLIPNFGTVSHDSLKDLLIKNKSVLAVLGKPEIDFMKRSDVDVISVDGKNYDFIFTDGKQEFEIINQDRKLKHPLRKARAKIIDVYSGDEYAKGGSITSPTDRLLKETNDYSNRNFGEGIDEESFMVHGYKKSSEGDKNNILFDYVIAETKSGKPIKVTPQELFKVGRYKQGGVISDEAYLKVYHAHLYTEYDNMAQVKKDVKRLMKENNMSVEDLLNEIPNEYKQGGSVEHTAYTLWKEAKSLIAKESDDLSAKLNSFPKSGSGMVSDKTRGSEKYTSTKKAFDIAFKKVKDFNSNKAFEEFRKIERKEKMDARKRLSK